MPLLSSRPTGRFGSMIGLVLALLMLGGGLLLAARGRAETAATATAPGWLNRQAAALLARALVAPPAAGEAMTPVIRFEAPWSQLSALAVLAGACLLVVWLYRREAGVPAVYRAFLAGLRIALVLLAMFFLSEAVLSVERTGLPFFAVLVDDSASASIADQPTDPVVAKASETLARAAGATEATRLDVARGWLLRDGGAVLSKLREQHKVRLYSASRGPRLLAEIESPEQLAPALDTLRVVQPAGAESRLGDSLRDVITELRGSPPTAILLLSDGQNTEGESLATAAEHARAKGVPLFPIGLGDPSPARDIELSDLQVDEVVFVEDNVRFEARLAGRGFDGESVTVKLRRRPADREDESAFLDIERIDVQVPPEGQSRRVELAHRPTETGSFVYELVVDPRPRERRTENNRIARPVSVREEKVKVLLVEGEPRYEYRYLLSFLKRDKTVDLRTVLQSSDPEYAEQEAVALPTFPTAKEGPDGLFEYDVVLFGDVDPSYLSAVQMQNLAEFVERRGGGLLFVAGQGFNPLSYRGTPLEPLLPIRLSEARDPALGGAGLASFRPALTAEGRGHPIFRFAADEAASLQVWDSLPMLDWFLEAPRKQELAFVLATHPTLSGSDGPLPLVLYQYVGAGKVLFQAFDETWKWRFRIGDAYFGRYWIQSIRFLARSKLIGKQAELTTDRRRYQRQQPVRIQVRFPNPGLAPAVPTLVTEVTRAGQPPRQVPLRRTTSAASVFEGVLPSAIEGQYEVKLLPPPILEGGLPSTTFAVEPPAGEFERTPLAEAELVRAATTSRGRYATPAITTDEWLATLPAPQLVPLDTDPPVPLWNSPALLGTFLTILLAEWLLRKRRQMV